MKSAVQALPDLWIAAASLRHGLALASLDGHFRDIDGLLLAAV
jgi:predicted nucleic acid-binding protein